MINLIKNEIEERWKAVKYYADSIKKEEWYEPDEIEDAVNAVQELEQCLKECFYYEIEDRKLMFKLKRDIKRINKGIKQYYERGEYDE